ncbi:MAG: hypothetical protein AAF697_14285, partial [Pseudomonadota bacterium]
MTVNDFDVSKSGFAAFTWAFIVFASCAMLASTPAAAQQINPLEVEQDANGVDYLSGKIRKDMPTLSIPAAPALTFENLSDFLPLLEAFAVPNSQTGDMSFSVNAGSIASDSLRCLEGPGECIGAKGSGSVFYGGGNAAPYYYTQGGSGKKITFTIRYGDQSPSIVGAPYFYVATQVANPGGETLTFTYDSAQSIPSQGANYIVRRPSVVSSSYGYQLRFTYKSNVATSGLWRFLEKAEIVKTSNPTVALASLTYSDMVNGIVTITDIDGRQYLCQYCQQELNGPSPSLSASMTLPGESTPSKTATATHQSDGHTLNVTTDGANYSYDVTDDPQFGSSYDAVDNIVITGPEQFYRRVEVSNFSQASMANLVVPPRKRIDSITNSEGGVTSYEYDSSQRVTKVTYPEGNSVSVTYDMSGNITSRTATPKPGSGQTALVEEAYYNSGLYCDNVTCFRPVWVRDPKGNQTDFTWSTTHGGMLTRLDPPDESNIRRKIKNTFDSAGRITRIETCKADLASTEIDCGTVSSFVQQITYFGGTQLPATQTVTDGLGTAPLTTTMTYDDAGRMLSQDGPLAGSDDATYYRYDILGRRTWEIGPKGENGFRLATRTTYRMSDDQVTKVETGNVVNPTDTVFANNDEVFQQVDTEYNARRLAVKAAVSSGGGTYTITEMSYDGLNRELCTAVRMTPA